MINRTAVPILILGSIVPYWALAAEKTEPQGAPEKYLDLMACRSIADTNARLACFDATSTQLKIAVQGGDVFLTDRTQVRKTRRSLFGLPLPDLGIFGDDDGPAGARLSEIESVVSTARLDSEGWLITAEDGSTWRQIDGTPVAIAPRKGMPVIVKRGALGSYKMSIRNQAPIKVRRTI